MRAFSFPGPELCDLVTREELEVPGPKPGDLSVPVRVHSPVDRLSPLPGVVAIHGGGYVIGDRSMYDGLFDRWCLDPGLVGVSVGYRRAPETPYPGPLEDCYRALKWTAANAEALGIDPSCIGLYGVSAGGGLAAGLTLLARISVSSILSSSFFSTPCSTTGRRRPRASSTTCISGAAALTRSVGRHTLGLYGGHDIPVYAAPARAEVIEGLPPAYLCVGAMDGFRDEDIAYAQRLLQAGVPTELHVLPGLPHGFDFLGDSPDSPSVCPQWRRMDPTPVAGLFCLIGRHAVFDSASRLVLVQEHSPCRCRPPTATGLATPNS